ncbi:nicotinamide N-methyltransferase [Microcaecilia unicolor]|uniref:Nicotinamide N-methyltransferase-like n=1 Tax=Microcaecilia unicolor TaxID=1415580 RepID=A0A6P7ZCE2_9AMPH|nr:nicotinamide N-methyltransferase-like [Microcaecilia unicolor]
MESEVTSHETYQKHFDPKVYLETYFAGESGLLSSDGYMKFMLENMFKIFTSGEVQGDILINIGFAPTIYQLLSACESFTEIIITDFMDQNLQEIESWLKEEPGAFDWSAVVKHACELEGDREKWSEKEAKVRGTVKRVLKCDVTQSNPLEPLVLPPADCLLTFLSLEAACKDRDTFCCALKNISSLLKPGGDLVMGGLLDATNYMVGERKFYSLLLDEEFLKKAIPEAGYELLQLFTQSHNNPTSLSDYSAYFFIHARKQTNTS